MASVSTSHLIIFVASLVVAAGVVGTLTTGVDRVSSSIQDGSLDVSQEVRTDVTIISDPGSSVVNEDGEGNAENVTIYVRNTGSQSIAVEEESVDLFFNGEFQTTEEFDIDRADGGEGAWRPDDVVEITITNTDPLEETVDHRLFLVVNGDEESFEFRYEEAT